MRISLALALALMLSLVLLPAACGSKVGGGDDDDPTGDATTTDACFGLECFQVTCPGGGTTSLSGVVYAPNGTLPLYNVTVYVPNGQLQAFPEGVTCDRCGALTGNPLVKTTTDTMGRFTLENVPARTEFPLVIQVGKWRRVVTIEPVVACEDTPLGAQVTRLPRNRSEGDIPRMALSTGGADALECLLRKIGLDDSEFGTSGGEQRVHLYGGHNGTNRFDDSTNGGINFAGSVADLWKNTATEDEITASLSRYDVVFLSCEGSQQTGQKSANARAGLKAYADVGGRVFASHWHNYWLEAGPAPWNGILTFNFQSDLNNITADVNTGFERGADLAEWLVNVQASQTLGQIPITAAQHTVTAVNELVAEKWIYRDQTANGTPSVQYMSFTTPPDLPAEQQCGRVVFSDIHVSSGDRSGTTRRFPSGGCLTDVNNLTPQEKVLAFMIFDIAACIGPIVD